MFKCSKVKSSIIEDIIVGMNFAKKAVRCNHFPFLPSVVQAFESVSDLPRYVHSDIY